MEGNFNKVIDHLITNEGGYSDHPMDAGGKTMYGVTKRNWERYTRKRWDVEDFKRLTPSEVKQFYKTEYWDRCNCDLLPTGIDYFVFDFAVNDGPRDPCVMLQKIVGTIPDGFIGDITLSALSERIKSYDNEQLAKKDLIYDMAFRRLELLSKRSNFVFFGKGWKNRIESVKTKCLELIGLHYQNVQRPIENSRTIKNGKKTVVTAVATAGATATQISLPDVSQIAQDISTWQTLAHGINGIFSYGIYACLGLIVIFALYQLYYRYQDYFTGERE